MNKDKRLKLTEISLLIMLWVVLIASPILFRREQDLEWANLREPLLSIIPLFIVFLLNRFVFVPYLLLKNRKILYFFTAGLLIALISIGLFYNNKTQERLLEREHGGLFLQNPPPHGKADRAFPPPPRQTPGHTPSHGGPIPPFANFLILSILLVGFDSGLKISFRLAEAENIKDKLEKENVETKLAFLRNQVSPHFFMNTLNNIHSLIDIDSNEAKESIIRLSKLMRHLLYDSENKLIPLQKEIDFIKNYVDLMRLRFSYRVSISLSLPDNIPDKNIPPLLFTSFLENAFKHGISYKNSSYIKISITIKENLLIFEVLNSNSALEESGNNSGIGVENSKKRLKLLYGEKYSLNINDENNEFYVNLSIPI